MKPSDAIPTALLEDATRRASAYLRDVDARRVFPSAADVAGLERFEMPLPEQSTSAEATLAKLDEWGSPAAVASAGPRYFGFVVGGALPVTVAAQSLAAAWDQCPGARVVSPLGAKLEEVAGRWLLDVLKLPRQASVGLVTGTSVANLSALAAARHAVLRRGGWDVEEQGLFEAPPVQVIVGEEAHITVLKAIALLGLGKSRVTRVPVDHQGRMRPEALPALSERSIVVVQAGNVNTGAFDPADEICRRAHDAGAWVHVDGAFGLWARAAPARAALAAGYDQADSWSTDLHKWLNVPYDCGAVICRHPEALHGAMSAQAAYLPQNVDREPYHRVPELSRRARGVEAWAALHFLGRAGIAELVERTCRHATRFAAAMRDAGYEVLNQVELNQVLVSFGDPETTRRVIAAVQDDGTCWCGGTEWQGRTAMRISVASWKTTDQDVERSIQAMLAAADRAQRS